MRRLGPKVRSGEARFGLELDWEKLWRGQVFGGQVQVQERLMSRYERQTLDWEKLWRGQVFGGHVLQV